MNNAQLHQAYMQAKNVRQVLVDDHMQRTEIVFAHINEIKKLINGGPIPKIKGVGYRGIKKEDFAKDGDHPMPHIHSRERDEEMET